ncbi:MAG: YfcE family phosphodiesterase [Bacilli bacterium]|nr:YfcE family phosphodiesterase [Bacilli bacterium]MBN2877404.1 YfcE family phosphodiesterase [Bacilli bacterium]
MKLLLFSDNHRDRESVKEALSQNPGLDHYISLGDSEMREQELTELGIYGVKGNYPFEPNFPKELTFVFEGWKVFLTHGHLFSVKLGLSRLLNQAAYNNIEIAAFGHTHRYMIKEINDVLFINPGSLSKNKMYAKASYALLDIQPESVIVMIKDLDGNVLEQYTKTR